MSENNIKKSHYTISHSNMMASNSLICPAKRQKLKAVQLIAVNHNGKVFNHLREAETSKCFCLCLKKSLKPQSKQLLINYLYLGEKAWSFCIMKRAPWSFSSTEVNWFWYQTRPTWKSKKRDHQTVPLLTAENNGGLSCTHGSRSVASRGSAHWPDRRPGPAAGGHH